MTLALSILNTCVNFLRNYIQFSTAVYHTFRPAEVNALTCRAWSVSVEGLTPDLFRCLPTCSTV